MDKSELKKFTKDIRQICEAEGVDKPLIEIAPEIVLEACDIIDRLSAEKFCPKCGCKMSLWCEKDVKERMDIKNKELQEEIDRLKKEIESYKFQIGEYQKLKD